MINTKKLFTILIIVTSLGLSSCGYITDKAANNLEVYRTDQMQTCKLDVNKLGEIFKADQKEQIRCLQDNFIQFTKYVRSREQGTITESEINAFVRKFFQNQSDSIIKGLSLIFQLNMLLLKDEADRISRTNISPLFDLLVHVNQEAVVITEIIKEMDDKNNQDKFWKIRTKFIASVTRFSDYTQQIIEKTPGMQKQLNMKQFILDAGRKLGNRELDPDTIDSLIFAKRTLAGGDKEVITTDELKTILGKLPKVMTLSFDLYYVKSSNFKSGDQEARFYQQSFRDLQSVMVFQQEDFDLFAIDKFLKVFKDFFHDTDITKFRPSISALKYRLVGGKLDTFSLTDMQKTFALANDVIDRIYFNSVTYDVYKIKLEQNTPIKNLPQLDLPLKYDVFTRDRINELHNEFVQTAILFRYFRNLKDGMATYGDEMDRSKYGYMEAGLLKFGTDRLLKAYGHVNSEGNQQVNIDEFKTFLFDLKPILVEMKLWSPNPDSFVRNAILLADLFQNKSDGDLEINSTEAVEYVQMIFSSVQMSNKFRDELGRYCDGGINKDDPVFETECFNEHFFESFLADNTFKKYFPRLKQYVENSPKEVLLDYLNGVEGFARDEANPKVPIGQRDTILILGSMLNIETTLIRFDTNHDNVIDYHELVSAFQVYKSAIISLAKLKPNQEGYAQSVFLYMAHKMEVPPAGSWLDSVKFFSFHTCVSWTPCRSTIMKKIEAQRLNVGKLLYFLVNQESIVAARAKKKNKTQPLLVNE